MLETSRPSILKEENVSIATHIPKILYSRYLSIEKLMFQLRKSSAGNIQTNVRLGKLDFLVRQKLKNDHRKWKEIPPIELPAHIAKPDLTLLKKKTKEEEVAEETNNLYHKEDVEMEDTEEATEEVIEVIEEEEEQVEDEELDNYIINSINNITKDDTKTTI